MLNAGKPIDESGVLMFPTIIIVLLLISLFMSINICFMYVGAPGFSAYIFTIVISCWVDPFTTM